MTGRGRGKALTRPAWMLAAESTPSLPKSSPASSEWSKTFSADRRPYWYSKSGATTWTDPTTSSSPNTPAPPIWKQVRTADGRLYYYNPATNQTQWDKPSDFKPIQSSSLTNSPPINENPSSSPPPKLPSGWAEHKTADARTYYYHAVTRETSWNFPTSEPPPLKPPDAPNSTNAQKRPATLVTHQWKEHQTPDGRTYYYNVATRETSWTKPSDLNSDPKRRRTSQLPDLRQDLLAKHAKKGQVVRRPRAPDGKPLSDRQAELYFIKRAQHRRDSSDAQSLPTPAPVPQLEAEARFEAMLKERNITEKSSWIEAMYHCSEDDRFLQLPSYGLRKHVWLKYVQKSRKRARRRSIAETREVGDTFNSFMTTVFAKEPYDVRSLESCRPESVTTFKADARFTAVDEPTRSLLIKAFFATRSRKAEAERALHRMEAMQNMRVKLDEMTDPSISGKTRVHSRTTDAAGNGEQRDSKQKHNGVNGKEPAHFTDRTSRHELENFLRSLPEAEFVNDNDRASIAREWRKDIERLVKEKEAKERDMRRAKQRENRATFRSGVEQMVLDGKLSITARWKDVAELISKQSFAVPEAELGARPVNLFDDGLECFETRVQKHKEEFKRILKEADFEVSNSTTVEDLQKTASIADFLKDMNGAVVDALLLERQRRESKRKQKERQRAHTDFEELLHHLDFASNVSLESAAELWKDRTAYKQYQMIGGDEAVKGTFNEYIERKKLKEDRRAKRKFDEQGLNTHSEPVVAPVDRSKRARTSKELPFTDSQREEENGWSAAVSAKPVTEAEKLEAREKRKRELLEAWDKGQSA